MKAFSATDVGKIREVNQDFIFTSTDPVGNLPNLFVVADGMGGHAAGDFASRFGTAALVETIKKYDGFNPIKIMREGINAANAAVYEASLQNPDMAGMGTTMVAASVISGENGTYLYVANVGDSRLYVAGDRLNQISQDHSLIAEMVRMGELDPEEAAHHPDKNIITRAIGTESEVRIDFFDMELAKGQSILMCSDGLTNMVEDGEIFSILQAVLPNEAFDPAGELVAAANRNGGRDNIAVIVIDPFA